MLITLTIGGLVELISSSANSCWQTALPNLPYRAKSLASTLRLSAMCGAFMFRGRATQVFGCGAEQLGRAVLAASLLDEQPDKALTANAIVVPILTIRLDIVSSDTITPSYLLV